MIANEPPNPVYCYHIRSIFRQDGHLCGFPRSNREILRHDVRMPQDRTLPKWHSRKQDRIKVEPWFAKNARDSRRAVIVFWERKSVQAAQTLFDPHTSTQGAAHNVPIWASDIKVHTFSSVEAFWAYVETQAKDQADVKRVRDAMNDAKDTRLKAQFERVEDQFAQAKRDLEKETLKVEKTVEQVTSV